jgi:hypothetical protein
VDTKETNHRQDRPVSLSLVERGQKKMVAKLKHHENEEKEGRFPYFASFNEATLNL